eukprot:4915552-Pyramimonas_sp.AAC.1
MPALLFLPCRSPPRTESRRGESPAPRSYLRCAPGSRRAAPRTCCRRWRCWWAPTTSAPWQSYPPAALDRLAARMVSRAPA